MRRITFQWLHKSNHVVEDGTQRAWSWASGLNIAASLAILLAGIEAKQYRPFLKLRLISHTVSNVANLSLGDIIKMRRVDNSLENVLLLDGDRIIIDELLGFWVKFDVKRVFSRPQGIRYSFTLHDKHNKRMMGFDNAHEIIVGGKKGVAPIRAYDHWHFDENDQGRPYQYISAGKLLEDFWKEVDKRVIALRGEEK